MHGCVCGLGLLVRRGRPRPLGLHDAAWQAIGTVSSLYAAATRWTPKTEVLSARRLQAPGVLWEQQSCTSSSGSTPVGPVKFNIVTVDLTVKNLNLIGVAANASVQLATVPQMAPTVPNALVGVRPRSSAHCLARRIADPAHFDSIPDQWRLLL